MRFGDTICDPLSENLTSLRNSDFEKIPIELTFTQIFKPLVNNELSFN